MNTKKLISTILALLLALQFIVPAFASEGIVSPETGEMVEEPGILPETPVTQEPGNTQTPDGIGGTENTQTPGDILTPGDVPDDAQEPGREPDLDDIQEPDAEEEPEETFVPEAVPLEDLIDVLVPDTGQMVINPYHLAVDMDGGEVMDQIVHAPQALVNLSGFPVTVNVVATGTIPVGSEAVFASTPPLPDAPGKEVFLYAEFQEQPDWWAGSYYGQPNQVPVSEWGTIGENVLVLDAGGEGYFRLFGAMSEAPESPWSDTDTFGAVLTFTFAPVYTEPVQAEEPENPEDAGTPPEEEVPGASEDVPGEESPEEPEIPEVPELPEVPEEPEAPAEPGNPEIPEDPPVENPPEEPEPSNPPEQDEPETPELPDAPVEPALPDGEVPEPSEASGPSEGESIQNGN